LARLVAAKANNKHRELYLTDVIAGLNASRNRSGAGAADSREVLGLQYARGSC